MFFFLFFDCNIISVVVEYLLAKYFRLAENQINKTLIKLTMINEQ